ncbi:MAG: hypothetical protein Q8Q26_11715, partial [Pseudorhodobacter sp.]|nr:hypothetical protein [Pseudorhodobacter sp.]
TYKEKSATNPDHRPTKNNDENSDVRKAYHHSDSNGNDKKDGSNGRGSKSFNNGLNFSESLKKDVNTKDFVMKINNQNTNRTLVDRKNLHQNNIEKDVKRINSQSGIQGVNKPKLSVNKTRSNIQQNTNIQHRTTVIEPRKAAIRPIQEPVASRNITSVRDTRNANQNTQRLQTVQRNNGR